VTYKGAGAFATIAPGVYDLGGRFTGATTNRFNVTSVSLAGGTSIPSAPAVTPTVTSSTATNRPL